MISNPQDVIVLYGSHGGTSEQAAKDFAARVTRCANNGATDGKQSSSENAGDGDGNTVDLLLVPVMELDEFVEDPQWRRLVVIFVSSFGSGGAPRNARKFRKLCDAWVERFQKANEEDPKKTKPLDGVQFALCGQGSSKYSTFQENPNKTVEALSLVGAQLVGKQGVTDANADGKKEQQEKDIETWVEQNWDKIIKCLSLGSLSQEQLLEMKDLMALAPDA